jgi:endonuclease/exonuclease/phosphatase family metal-dependent hydrolase
MRLISLNCALFEKNNQQIAAFLKAENPDIFCGQEITRQLGKKADPDYVCLPTIEAATPNLSHSYLSNMWVIKNFRAQDFHGAADYVFDFGDWLELGEYTRTKYPLPLGQTIFVKGRPTQYEDFVFNSQDDNRAFQVSDLMVGETKKPNLRVINYHGIWSKGKLGDAETIAANQKILEYAKAVCYPVIIVGDFNLFPDTPSMQLFYQDLESLVDTYDIKTTRPESNELSATATRNVVDFCLVSKGIKVNSFSVPNLPVSDHLPLILDFDLI